jgi:hypothetical protein
MTIPLETLVVHLYELRALALEYGKRGDAPKKDDPPAAYFYGIEAGYEEAAERLEALMRAQGWTP